MRNLLALHRAETEPVAPAEFLAHFPASVIQYLDDSPRGDPRKARSATRFSPDVAARKQDEGCGVYFAPNAFDGRRRLERLLQIRAAYLDIDVAKERDGLPTAAIDERKERALIDLLSAEIRPHAVIETKNGLQPLWLVRPERIDRAVHLFRAAMAALLRRFGGDPAVKDPTRVLRLPGYVHLKTPTEPFRCRLVWNELDREPIALQTIIDTYGVDVSASIPTDRPRQVIPPPAESIHETLDVAEVARAAAAEAGIAVTFRRNTDGSRQIIENGEITSGFVSARGNFCYSASGKPRRGGPLPIVRYYLNLSPSEARRWLDERFGPGLTRRMGR